MDITSQTGFVEAARARFKPLISKRLSGPDGARAGGLACVAAGRAADHNISVHIYPNQVGPDKYLDMYIQVNP